MEDKNSFSTGDMITAPVQRDRSGISPEWESKIWEASKKGPDAIIVLGKKYKIRF